MPNGNEGKRWQEYRNAGGPLTRSEWVLAGRPSTPTPPTPPLPQQAAAFPGTSEWWNARWRGVSDRGLPSVERQARPTPQVVAAALARPTPEEEAAGVGLAGLGVDVPPQPSEPPPEGFRWAFDRELNRWVPMFAGLTAQQRSQQEAREAEELFRARQLGAQTLLGQERLTLEQEAAQRAQEQQLWGRGFQQQQLAQQLAQQQQQFGFQEQQQAQQQAQFQAQLEFQQQQQQAAQQEQERQYMSQLAANPINWLQYETYTGQPAVQQPWMLPLGFQDQTQVQVGQVIPGQTGAGDYANLPALTTPSAQLQARWGPTAQAQFLGYRQARTGAAPQETQFRLGSGRAPTGAFRGFSRFR